MLNLKKWLGKDFYINTKNILGIGIRENPEHKSDLSKPKLYIDIMMATQFVLSCPIKTDDEKKELLSNFNLQ